jgi:hypothetical protein
MCIIIDTNTLSSVFDSKSVHHKDFLPIKEWIIKKKGKIIFGGTKLRKETPQKYIALYNQLSIVRKIVRIDDKIVDDEVDRVSKMVSHPDFDDPHIVALLRVSGCKLVCTNEHRAIRFFRHDLFFSPAKNKPRIYKSSRNSSLISDSRTALCPCCNPQVVLTKKEQDRFNF